MSDILNLSYWPLSEKGIEIMKIVAVSACTAGIAHTYMAQEALEQECEKRGIEIKVETQGGMGIDNELEQDEIDEAVELAQN